MSFSPMALFGHPSASAIGFHIAITTGFSSSGSDSPAPDPAHSESASKFSTDFHREFDGDHTVGWNDLSAICFSAVPLSHTCAVIKMGLSSPGSLCFSLLNFAASGSIHGCFSDEYANVTSMALSGLV